MIFDDTLINYREDNGFWIQEPFVEILSEYICNEYEKNEIESYSPGLQRIYRDCDTNRKGESIGMVNILFDEAIKSVEDEYDLITILENVKNTLLVKDEKIEIEELNEIESRKTDDCFKIEWNKPIYISSINAVLDIMIKMLKGELQSKSYAIRFKGFGAPDGAEEV